MSIQLLEHSVVFNDNSILYRPPFGNLHNWTALTVGTQRISGTVYTNAQPNITSVSSSFGNLTLAANNSITLSGVNSNITGANLISATNLSGNHSGNFSGNGSFSNTLTVIGAATFANTLLVNGAVTFANQMNFSGNGAFSNTLSVVGATTLSNTLTVNGSSQIYSLGVGTPASGTVGEIRANNNITAYYTSDASFKENVKPIQNALEKVMMVDGVEFDWTEEFMDSHGGEDGYFVRRHDVGVIAQNIEKVLPEVVATREDGTKAVKYDRIVALLIEAIKELKKEVDSLKG